MWTGKLWANNSLLRAIAMSTTVPFFGIFSDYARCGEVPRKRALNLAYVGGGGLHRGVLKYHTSV